MCEKENKTAAQAGKSVNLRAKLGEELWSSVMVGGRDARMGGCDGDLRRHHGGDEHEDQLRTRSTFMALKGVVR